MQLAFRNAPVPQRLLLHCHLEITEYIHRWSGNDFAQIGAHRYNEIREDLWPWLRERQYAGPEDDQQRRYRRSMWHRGLVTRWLPSHPARCYMSLNFT